MEAKAPNHLTREERKLILVNQEKGLSFSEIAGIIQRSKSVLFFDKIFEPKLRTSRPQTITKWKDQMIVKMSLKDYFNTATSISHAFCEQIGKPVSRKTISLRLNKEKLVAWIPCHKPLISKKNRKVHLRFTTEHILWTEEQWNMFHFSDESKFSLFGSDGTRFVRCKMGNAYLFNTLSKLWNLDRGT